MRVVALEGWDATQNVRGPDDSIHEWDVYDEATGTLRTLCGQNFLDGLRSPDWVATNDDITCTSCLRRLAQGRN